MADDLSPCVVESPTVRSVLRRSYDVVEDARVTTLVDVFIVLGNAVWHIVKKAASIVE